MSILESVAQRMFLGTKRHAVIAGNIANAQTPGYIPKDVEARGFASQLAMVTSNTRHLAGSSSGAIGVVNRADDVDMASLDGNRVDLDKERALMAMNALDVEAQIRFANHYLRQKQIAVG
jgi:flagellar basal-body rod protein FlgB